MTADPGALVSVEKGNASPTAPRRVAAIPNFSRGAAADGTAVAGALAKATKAVTLPARPIPWALDTGRIAVSVQGGQLSQERATFSLACGGSGYRRPFKVRTCNLDTGWFDVEPKEGVIESGRRIEFTVTFKSAALNARRHYAAAFLVRTDDGFSRPVTLHAETDFVAPFKVENPRDIVVYGQKTGERTWTFEVPEKHTYYVFLRGSNPKTSGNFFQPAENKVVPVIDGVKRAAACPQLKAWPTWAPVNPETYNITGFEFDAGTHEIELAEVAEGVSVEGLALAHEPSDMEGQSREE